MNNTLLKTIVIFCSAAIFAAAARAHEGSAPEFTVTNVMSLPFAVEWSGPVRAPKPSQLAPGQKASGQGFWKFVAARDLVPVPAAAQPKVVGAHGTIIVDKAADVVYWGLQGVGWVGFSNKLKDSWIVAGNPAFAAGNLHGADILPRGKKARDGDNDEPRDRSEQAEERPDEPERAGEKPVGIKEGKPEGHR